MTIPAAPSRSQVLYLYRSLLRSVSRFKDYNLREYAKRKTLDDFRKNRVISDPSASAFAFAYGEAQLEVVRRQVSVYDFYTPELKSIMEIKHAP